MSRDVQPADSAVIWLRLSTEQARLRALLAATDDPQRRRALLAALDALYERGAYLRAVDPEIRRLRRQLRRAA